MTWFIGWLCILLNRRAHHDWVHGEGFRVEANGAITRDFDATNFQDCRRALASTGRYVEGLSDRLNAGQPLSDSDRVALANARRCNRAARHHEGAERGPSARKLRASPAADASTPTRRRAIAHVARRVSEGPQTTKSIPRTPCERSFLPRTVRRPARSLDGWGDGRMSAAQEFCRCGRARLERFTSARGSQ